MREQLRRRGIADDRNRMGLHFDFCLPLDVVYFVGSFTANPVII